MALETWVAEMAREELQMLEVQHPDRFGYLKLELQSLISQPSKYSGLFNSNNDDKDDDASAPHTATSTVPTQVSCNRKRKHIEGKDQRRQQKIKSLKSEQEGIVGNGGGRSLGDRRVEMAIKRAEACLERIQLVKQSFLS